MQIGITGVIIFTEYRTTHQWLYEILATRGYGGERLAILHGGMDQEEREKVKAAFQTHPDDAQVRILLATDAASEGIDLQNHCNCLIHLEIPYNPNVMEQRNGELTDTPTRVRGSDLAPCGRERWSGREWSSQRACRGHIAFAAQARIYASRHG